jgi:ectoine hydroxylase-related dioxygenase (phytanoyl-CoA dioxygenase family)
MPATLTDPQLTTAERDQLLATLERDGFCTLPMRLPEGLHQRVEAAIDRVAAQRRAADPGLVGVKVQNCVDEDQAFRDLMCFTPALQLCHDVFGPMLQLNQSNMVSRPKAREGVNGNGADSIGWHADGPRPGLFPRVGPERAMGLHYLKFGYFLNDVPIDGSPLQVVRGSHRRDEKDGRGGAFDIADYAADLVTLTVPAGTIIAFHQALWHAAAPNSSGVERKNVYLSYCPTWMRPGAREFPTEAQLEGCTPVERWLLGEPRPALRWWLPNEEDRSRLAAYGRQVSA